MGIIQGLNNYIGLLIAAATIALVTNSVVMYGDKQGTDQRINSLEEFKAAQQRMNSDVIKMGEIVKSLQRDETDLKISIKELRHDFDVDIEKVRDSFKEYAQQLRDSNKILEREFRIAQQDFIQLRALIQANNKKEIEH